MFIDLGFPISLIGVIISLYGVYLNNQKRDHTGAMAVWMYSNPILTVYFIGLALGWWNGGLSAAAMVVLYGVFTVSNLHGLIGWDKPLSSIITHIRICVKKLFARCW